MSVTTEKGLLVKFDEGMIDRMNHETAQRRAALKGVAPSTRLFRTEVIRSLLTFALDHFARKRGEEVPESEEFVSAAGAPRAATAAPTTQTRAKAMAAEAGVEIVASNHGQGPTDAEGVEGGSADTVAPPAPLVEPDKVQPSPIGGNGSLGSHVRMVGVRS